MCEQDVSSVRQKEVRVVGGDSFSREQADNGHKYSSVLLSASTGCQHEGWRGKDTRLASFLLAKGCGCYGTHDPPHKQNLVCLISESKCPCDLS